MEIFEFIQPVIFHKTLNPKLWDGENLHHNVLVKLLQHAELFLKSLKMDKIPLRDIIITGSNTNFTYTDYSDLDIHIVVDFDKVYGGKLVDDFFNAKKSLWNATYDVEIRGIPVEIYVENSAEPVEGNSYSLLTQQWLVKKPLHKTQFNDRSVKAKTRWIESQLKKVLGVADESSDIELIKTALRKYRKAGLDKYGEFSTENLVFKSLRNAGWFDKLKDKQIDLVNTQLSLK